MIKLHKMSLAAGLALCSVVSAVAHQPNIVVILTDDMGYGDVSKFNPEAKLSTPHMDALAESGVWCTDAHSTTAVCSPSRYGLLTGRYPWRGKLKLGIVDVFEESVIEKDRYCLPQMMKDQGYRTACIGKWHLGFDWPIRPGAAPTKWSRRDLHPEAFDWTKPIKGGALAIGFDHYYGDDVPNFAPYAFIEDDHLTCDPVYLKQEDLLAVGEKGGFRANGPGEKGWKLENVMPAITQRAVDYVHEMSQQADPFFLYFSTTSPHTPVVPTQEFQGKSDAGFYGDYVVQTDDAIGQVIAALKASGQFDNTLLIVTSDNGPSHLIMDDSLAHGHNPSAKWRGQKTDLWEAGHRVPFIVSWPAAGLSGGREMDQLISLVDIYATVAGILGVDLPDNSAEDSLNVWDSWAENKPTRTEMVYQSAAGYLALRQHEWVMLKGPGTHGADEYGVAKRMSAAQFENLPLSLYNLKQDPAQQDDVIQAHPEKAGKMSAHLDQIRHVTQ